MAHHQRKNLDRMHSAQATTVLRPQSHPSTKHATEEDEPGEPDEPPDAPLQFSKLSTSSTSSTSPSDMQTMSSRFRAASLLTQALTSPDLTALSDTDAPHLTSDGGLTSPARTTTPSPPLPATTHALLPFQNSQEASEVKAKSDPVATPHLLGPEKSRETKVEEGLGRKRCITFACGQSKGPDVKDSKTTLEKAPILEPASRRACMLRFACPSKPARGSSSQEVPQERPRPMRRAESEAPSSTTPHITITSAASNRPTTTAETSRSVSQEKISKDIEDKRSLSENRKENSPLGARAFNRVDFQKSEATRFHEFAGSFTEDDEWTHEQTAFRQKITIDDTLRKENAIRQIAKEAEEEALEEEANSYANDEVSDGGNETDDEEGFADSDDESDAGSEFQFWTPGLTTAATSTDHMEHFRPAVPRLGSESSIESVLEAKTSALRIGSASPTKRRKSHLPRAVQNVYAGTSDLPESSDFMIGTIDEDQPLEDDYKYRRRRREQLKQKLIPQDIDPSFPNSDPEAENDEDDDASQGISSEEEDEYSEHEEEEGKATESRDQSDDEGVKSDSGSSSRADRRPHHAPGPRLRSPPPQSRRLFGGPTHRLRSPPPLHRKISSPPSSRRASPNGHVQRATQGVNINRLAQRPNLTQTTSLPRTPNPFWIQHRNSSFYGSESSIDTPPKEDELPAGASVVHARGPIDIVQGLEAKRQRRKEKFWRQHCRIAHAGKEKERKCQPGKGVQRMRELGLEMADRFKNYKQGTQQLVLSI